MFPRGRGNTRCVICTPLPAASCHTDTAGREAGNNPAERRGAQLATQGRGTKHASAALPSTIHAGTGVPRCSNSTKQSHTPKKERPPPALTVGSGKEYPGRFGRPLDAIVTQLRM